MRIPVLACILALAACQTPGASVAVPGTHSVRHEQSLQLPDGSRLDYVRLVADSRCRPDVQCIRAGDADIELRWQPASGVAVSVVLNSDPRNPQRAPNTTRIGPWRVALAALGWQQPPAATLVISRADQGQ